MTVLFHIIENRKNLNVHKKNLVKYIMDRSYNRQYQVNPECQDDTGHVEPRKGAVESGG